MRLVQNAIVTPASYNEDARTFRGAVYDRTRIVGEGLRASPGSGAWRHDDEVIVTGVTPRVRLARAVYGGRFFFHFGHFLLETLPGLGAARPDTPIIFHPWPAGVDVGFVGASFRGFFLEALGLQVERVMLVQEHTLIDNLHVPDLDAAIVGDARPDGLLLPTYRRVREYALGRSSSPGSGAVYLSRRKFGGRGIADEEKVEAIFASFGFQIVFPEQMPISEQVATVARAEVVAGIDGSALHLTGFMAPGSRVVVLQTRPTTALDGVCRALGAEVMHLPVDEAAIREGLSRM